jgi:hypothetical protein
VNLNIARRYQLEERPQVLGATSVSIALPGQRALLSAPPLPQEPLEGGKGASSSASSTRSSRGSSTSPFIDFQSTPSSPPTRPGSVSFNQRQSRGENSRSPCIIDHRPISQASESSPRMSWADPKSSRPSSISSLQPDPAQPFCSAIMSAKLFIIYEKETNRFSGEVSGDPSSLTECPR